MAILLPGRTQHVVEARVVDGVTYRDCPAWVPAAVQAAVAADCVPSPVEITWHPKPLKSLLGRCWPDAGRIHVHPWSGARLRVDEHLDVDASGELRTGVSRVSRVAGQDEAELEDTLAHELAHLVYARHGAAHRALTERIVGIVKASRQLR